VAATVSRPPVPLTWRAAPAGTKQTRTIKREVPKESFFNFFDPPKVPEDEDAEARTHALTHPSTRTRACIAHRARRRPVACCVCLCV
jgi:hypothetical protein